MPTWSGLWNGQVGQPYAPLNNAGNGNTADHNRGKWSQLARLTRGPSGRRMGALIRTLTGQAPGALAQASTYQVPSNPAPGQSYSGGGYIRAVQKYDINRNTTAADETWIDSATQEQRYPTYVKDKSGAGGAKGPGYF